MTFYPAHRRPPHELRTPHFLLEPLAPNHVTRDYAAVMAGRKMLHLWGGHDWPADSFTLEENLADLRTHFREHNQRIAFTYTVLDPGGETCLGCIYIRNLAELAAVYPEHGYFQQIGDFHAHLRFWVIPRQQKPALEQFLLGTLQKWLYEAWAFDTVLLHTRAVFTPQVRLFTAAGLQRLFSLDYPGRGGTHHFYQLNG